MGNEEYAMNWGELAQEFENIKTQYRIEQRAVPKPRYGSKGIKYQNQMAAYNRLIDYLASKATICKKMAESHE